MAQLVGHCPAKWTVASLVPGQGTCVGFGFGPWLGRIGEATEWCLTSLFLSTSLSLPSLVS